MSIDTQSLAVYLDANQKLQRENAELIAEFRAVLTEVLTSPMWVSIGGVQNVARLDVPRDLYHRAWSILERSE